MPKYGGGHFFVEIAPIGKGANLTPTPLSLSFLDVIEKDLSNKHVIGLTSDVDR